MSEDIAHFHPSLSAQKRIAELLERERETHLSAEEKSVLDQFIELENILRVAKAKAQQLLARGK